MSPGGLFRVKVTADDPIPGYSPRTVASAFAAYPRVASIHPFTATFRDRLLLRHPGSAVARRRLDAWIKADCAGQAKAVVAKLLNATEDVGAVATFYELLTGQALKRLFGNAAWEPHGLPCAGQPDWAVDHLNGQVVFEVRYLDEDMPEAERRGKELFRRLATVVAPWVIVVDWDHCENLEHARVSVLARAFGIDYWHYHQVAGRRILKWHTWALESY